MFIGLEMGERDLKLKLGCGELLKQWLDQVWLVAYHGLGHPNHRFRVERSPSLRDGVEQVASLRSEGVLI